jgi:acyl carrier protein
MSDTTVDEFAEKIIALIAEAVPRRYRKAGLRVDMQLQRDLGLDSLGLAALVFRLEAAFGIDLSTIDLGAQMGSIRTVGDAIMMSRKIVDLVRALQQP